MPESMHFTMSADCLKPVAILWDIENCAVPHGVNAEDVAVHIRMALKFQLAKKGPVTVFSAYGDFSHLSLRTRQGCQKTGVNLIDIPHGKKDAADKAILVDMFLFALDNPPPCTVVLISGDVDFAPALHKLGQRGYSVVLAIPSGRKVSPALLNACEHLWSWPDIAHGKGTHSTHNAFLQCTFHECHGEDTSPSTILTPPITCATILSNKPSETVVPNAITSLTSTIKDGKPSEMITPHAESVCIDQVKGNDCGKKHFFDAVGDDHNFGKLEVGPNDEVSKKVPVNMFEERVKVPFYATESTVIPAVMGMDHNGMGTAEIPVAASHGIVSFAEQSVEVDCNGRGASDMNRSKFPPSCGIACPMGSRGTIAYENIHRVTSQGMNDHVSSSIRLAGQHVSDQFAIPYPGGATGVFEEVFGHSWKDLAHQMEANYEHHLASFPLHVNAQGPVTRSFRQLFTNFKCAKAARKQAVCAKGPSLQLKMKKKKMKKENIVEAASAATPKLTRKQRKAARSAAIQTQGSELHYSLSSDKISADLP